ncbi:MAG TPA: hypothetical protein GYA10_12360 [Alphaproteobacteria bacterium]|nr:hypothetical protein [Alphaproteobacteria bacterium]
MPTKADELKQRLAAVLRDLQREGGKDPEAIWLIGSLAAELADKAKAKSWPALKESMTQEMYEGLLRDFQTTGNALYQAGESKKAYAIQALGLSLVCLTQRHDAVLRDGEALLDSMIEGAVAIFRKTRGKKPN